MKHSPDCPMSISIEGCELMCNDVYAPVNGRPPAEADILRFFRVTPPRMHQMVLTLAQAGLI